MPIVTGKITWRSSTANKNYAALLTALRNFIVNSGNYTLVSDQIGAGASGAYFVVKSTRNTGFAGDSIVAQISIMDAQGNFSSPFLSINAWESWSGVTGTNYGVARPGYGSQVANHYASDHTQFSLVHDTDIWISCDTTFLLTMSRVNYPGQVSLSYWQPAGVVNFERLAGDSDLGSYYGHWGYWTIWGNQFYTPKRWDNSTGDNSWFQLSTKIIFSTTRVGIGMHSVDEGGNHVVFDVGVSLPSYGKIKGRLYGVGVATYGNDLAHGMLIPSAASPQYIVGKAVNIDPASTIVMQTATTITNIAT